MERINISKDISFSRISLGFWRLLDWKFTPAQLMRFTEECMDLGITTMDHADIYGGYTVEEIFGRAVLKKNPALRNKMEIVTKCGIVSAADTGGVKHYNYSQAYIISQVEKSLKNLGVDHIETLLLHRPSPMMNPSHVAHAFDKLYAQGKVKTFGVSNFLPHQYSALKSHLNVPIVTNQVELSPLCLDAFEDGNINLALQEKFSPMVWSPVGGGKIFTGQSPAEVGLRNALETIREEIGANDIGEVVFAWILSHPSKMIPIVGSGKIQRVKIPVNAAKYKLSLEQWFTVWTAAKGQDVP